MSSAPNSLSRPEESSGSGSLRKTTTPGQMAESILKELNESLCCVVINASTCLRMLSADPPNVEGAREAGGRTIGASNRAAEAVSHLRALFSETNKRIEAVCPSKGGSSRVAQGGTL
jgi:hypothetical protein